MGLENVSDKININLGDGGGRGGNDGGAMAALVAALGTRNQGGDHAGLIAALGNRNSDGNLAPLLAMMHNRNDGDGLNSMWPLLLLLGLGRGGHGGGFFGGGDGGGDGCTSGALGASILQTLTEGQADIRAQIPTVALENQNAILGAIARSDLGIQQGFANTKDAVQNTLFALTQGINNVNQNVSAQGCQTRETVQAGTTAVLQRMDSLRISELEHERDRAERNNEITALRSQVEITNVNTATATQAQGQLQAQLQFQDINNKIDRLCGAINVVGNQVQRSQNANDTINFGTMTGSGIQTASNASNQVR